MSEVEAETAADRTGAARDAQWPRPTVAGPPTNPEAVRTDSINIGKENQLCGGRRFGPPEMYSVVYM